MSQNRVLGAPLQQEKQTQSFSTDWVVDQYLVDAALGGPVTVTLDPNAVTGDQVEIVDIAGNALAQPITIVASPGQSIFASGSVQITTNFGSATLTFNSVLQVWVLSLTGASEVSGQAFVQGGNSFGATAVLGTNDLHPLIIEVQGVNVLQVPTGPALGSLWLFRPGSAAFPAYSFQLEMGTGMYRPSAGVLGFASLGTETFTMDQPAPGISNLDAPTSTALRIGGRANALGTVTIDVGNAAVTPAIDIGTVNPALVSIGQQGQVTVVSGGTGVGGFALGVNNLADTANTPGIVIVAGSTAAGTSEFISFKVPLTGEIGSIAQSGTNSVMYNTVSDARLKENVRDSSHGLDVLRRVRVRDFNFIGSTERRQGLIAQELMEVYPDAVSLGGEDPKEQPWGIDHGRLTPLLALAIQELQAKHDKEIAALREAFDALKKKVG